PGEPHVEVAVAVDVGQGDRLVDAARAAGRSPLRDRGLVEPHRAWLAPVRLDEVVVAAPVSVAERDRVRVRGAERGVWAGAAGERRVVVIDVVRARARDHAVEEAVAIDGPARDRARAPLRGVGPELEDRERAVAVAVEDLVAHR